ncbi:MAG: LamG-like jellyroll fold domain-containing protein, partial [Anaerohalosphaeraceae bacterium]
MSKTFIWYKNGLVISARNLDGHVMTYDMQWPVMIGACSQDTAHQYLPGTGGQALIDEVRIYDYVLNADDIFELYGIVKPEPVFLSQPISNVADTGGSVNFKISTKSLTEVNYQWYRDGDMLTDEDNKVAGSQTDSLTVSNIVEADLGDYWCVATNAGGTATSDTAKLDIKRIMGHWSFDEINGKDPNLFTPDISGNGNDALLINGPALTGGPGSGNKGMAFDSSVQTRLEVANESYFDSLKSMTVSAWVKTTWAGGDWRPVVCKGGEDNVGWMLRRYSNTGQANFTLRGTSAGDELASGVNVNDNTWHLLTGTYDGVIRKIYVDGVLRNSVQDSGEIAANDYKVFIGANPWNSYYTGSIDDVRIYNYALASEEVAMLYIDVVGGSVCMEHLEYDLSNDCRVDIEDFVIMASGWLECGIYPPIACP